MDEREIKQALDEMCKRHSFSDHILGIRQWERKQEKIALTKFGRFVSQFEMFFDLINSLTVGVNFVPKDKWPRHRTTQFLLCVNNIRFFYSSFDRMVKGLTTESIILSRPLFETFIRITYASCYPSKSDAVLAPVKITDGTKFNMTNFIKDHLALDWRVYQLWSAHPHSNSVDVFKDLDSVQKGESKVYSMRLSCDERDLQAAINLLSITAITFLRIVPLLFVTSYNDSLKQEDVERSTRLADLWQAGMRCVPKFWPEFMDDLDFVFEIIRTAEQGGDWQKLTSERKAKRKVAAPRNRAREVTGS